MKIHKSILFILLAIGSSCSINNSVTYPPEPIQNTVTTPILTATPTPEIVPTNTAASSRTAAYTSTPTITATPAPANTPTPSITPTYAILRGEVNVGALSCRYGPAYMYLFKYGVYEGDYLEIFGRNGLGTWILIRAIGGTNACWVNASYLDIGGDVMSVAPVDMHVVMPWTYLPDYYRLSGVTAIREGNTVNLSWNVMYLIAGDDFDTFRQAPYIIEAWVCNDSEIVEIIKGAWSNHAELVDEPGCETLSYGRVLGTEKHGYTDWVNFVWPPHDTTDTDNE